MSFVNLHDHDEYSLLDGAGTAKQYAMRAAELGQPALAITNHGTLAGVLHHMNACHDAGVLPITGCEVYYRPNRKVQGQKELRYAYFHLTLLAANATGWTNLMRLVSEAHISGFYEKPCVDPDLLRRYGEGIICGTGCLGGWLCQCIANEDDRAVEAWMIELKSIFRDRLFAEIMPNALPEQVDRNPLIIEIADRHSVIKCATVDAHAPYREWVQEEEGPSSTHDILLMINTNSSLKKRDEKRAQGKDVFEFNDPTFYLQSEQEVWENFALNHPLIPQTTVEDMIKNTVIVASWTTPFLISRHDKLPKFDRGEPDIQILRRLTYEGLKRHGTSLDPVYQQRAEEELKQIDERGVAAYFLMVRDVIEWCESDRGLPDENGYEKPGDKEPIEVGPGRGSAGGSLVSDSIGITNMDPIAYRLMFERFLNPDRKGLPDIDVDFPADRIDEVEEYTKRRFGKDHVVDIIAHSTFGPRQSIRRVGMALNLPFQVIDDAAKSIDEGDRSALEDLRRLNQPVETLASEFPNAWKHMTRLQGQIYGKSEHAAALLVTPPELPIQDAIPIERIGGQTGKLITAWGERAGKGNAIISDYGYNKFDWLRVVELDKQVYACKLIQEETGERIRLRDLQVHRDPYATEPEVMKGFADGWLTGIFQFSATAAKLTRKLRPETIFDLAAINALIRPGPRGNRDDVTYVERKNGKQPVTYWHPILEPYLDYTQGVMVFQEQLIEAVHYLGGLSKADADNFRKIASKLYRDPEYAREQMGVWYEPIKAGFMANGITEEAFGDATGGGDDGTEPTGIWANFLSFSDYSFNLAHAAGYALLAYRDMWLKVHYPRQFYAAFLSKGLPQKKERRIESKERAVREARNRGFVTLPPDVNESQYDYTVTPDGIRIGISSISNVGPVASKEVISKRVRDVAGQPLDVGYSSYQDFEGRVIPKRCNRTAKAALICAGAFDRFGMRDHYTEERIDEMEREFIGISVSSVYSIINYADILEGRVWNESQFDEADDGQIVTIAGEVVGTKEWRDKKGGLMCFVDLAYGADEFSVTFFAHTYKLYAPLIHSHRPIILVGSKNTHNGRSGIVPLDPEPRLNSDNTVVTALGDDGLMHEVWTHYVQDVDELAKLERPTKEPTDLVTA